MGNLQRKTFEHLKKHLEDPSEFKNFKVFLDTCDIRTVQFLGKVKVGDEGNLGLLNIIKSLVSFSFGFLGNAPSV